jgi:hypothetical protein
VLLLGIAIGRLTARRTPAGATTTVASARPAAPDSVSSAGVSTSDVSTSDVSTVDLPAPVRVATSEYLGRAQALLAALPAQLHARRADPAYLSRADDLLLQTRLLLDSPAATDPALRALFDDLEMVLAQVVRLPRDHDALRVELLNQSLEQRDVLPRLRDAVADTTD